MSIFTQTKQRTYIGNQLKEVRKPTSTLNLTQFYIDAAAMGATIDSVLFEAELNALPAIVKDEATYILVPGVYKSGMIYGLNPDTGTIEEFTFSRSSAATYFDKNGVLQTAPAGMPRIDFDPDTKICKGYLLEAASTNLLTESNFTNWAQSSCTAENVSDPKFGTVQKITSTVAASNAMFKIGAGNDFTGVEGSTMCRSVYVKSGVGINAVAISTYDNSTTVCTEINLTTGEVRIPASYADRNACWSEYVGDGWWRLVVNYNHASQTNKLKFRIYFGPTVYTSTPQVGDYFYIAYPQAEANITRPTSVLVSSGSQTTRTLDNFQSVNDIVPYSAATVYTDISNITRTGSYLLSKGANGRFFNNSSAGGISAYDGINSVSHGDNSNASLARRKLITSYGLAGLKAKSNTAELVSTSVYDGDFGSGPLIFNEGGNGMILTCLKTLAIFSRQLTDAEHITVTS